jgi:hypothetical protein
LKLTRKKIATRRRWAVVTALATSLAIGGVLVGGAASSPDGAATVVYVVSRSGSMGTPVDSCRTRLACVKAAIAVANNRLHDRSAVGSTGLAISNPAGPAQDVDLGARGAQLLVGSQHDGNANGRPDLADAASRLSLGGATCYSCGLGAARTIIDSASTPSARNVVVFIADRPNQIGAGIASLSGLLSPDTVVRAIAVGPRTTCGPQRVKVGRGGRTEVWVGSLAPVAALGAGGSCVHTNDFASLADVIDAAVG